MKELAVIFVVALGLLIMTVMLARQERVDLDEDHYRLTMASAKLAYVKGYNAGINVTRASLLGADIDFQEDCLGGWAELEKEFDYRLGDLYNTQP